MEREVELAAKAAAAAVGNDGRTASGLSRNQSRLRPIHVRRLGA